VIGSVKEKFQSICVFIGFALVWELISRLGLVSPLYFPPISKIMITFFNLTISGTLPIEVFKSFGRMACGFFGAALIMIPLGISMGMSKTMFRLFDPVIEFFRPLPPPAIIPAVMLFLGISHSMKIFVIFFSCSFPIVLNTLDGVRQIPPLFIDTARSFSIGHSKMLFKVILPCALPQIMSGLRISLPISLIVAVLSEMIGSVDGIGHYILHMQRIFNISEMYAGIVMIGIVGFILNLLFLKIDQSLLAWHAGWKTGH
jgi:ABC-type nitrate/sulfonate/bicarbonate transport system permease component